MNLNSIAFIPDGNRRYSQVNNISLAESYSLGTEKAWQVLNWLTDYPKIKQGTFFTLALENFLERSKTELEVLFKIYEKELDKIKTRSILQEYGIKLKFIGHLNLFPQRLREKMKAAEEYTKDFNERTLNLALCYSGQTEIVDAAKKIAEAAKNQKIDLSSLDSESFNNYLYSSSLKPDLIIRTSGIKRLSGFLTYQSAYSELFFLDKYWPEFSRQDLDNAVEYFKETQRNFGK